MHATGNSAALTMKHPSENQPRYLVRVHPVVAEMRDIQKKLAGSWRGFVTAFFVVVVFVFVTDLIGAVIRALWKLVQP